MVLKWWWIQCKVGFTPNQRGKPTWGAGGGGGERGYVCPEFEFQIRSFRILRSRPCPCRYLTQLYIICHLFIWSYVAVSKPCCLLKFYPNMASVLNTNMKINTNNTWLSQQHSVPETNCFWLQKKLHQTKWLSVSHYGYNLGQNCWENCIFGGHFFWTS